MGRSRFKDPADLPEPYRTQAMRQLGVPEKQIASARLAPKQYCHRTNEAVRREIQSRYVVSDLPARTDCLTLWFPNLRLPSENQVLGSGVKLEQSNAKRRVLDAVLRYDGPVWRFTIRVDVYFLQVFPKNAKLYDPDNLFTKPLLDALTESHRGLPILVDDNARCIRRVSREIEVETKGRTPGVEVRIVPVGTTID